MKAASGVSTGVTWLVLIANPLILIFFLDTKITNTFVSNMQNCKLLTLFDTGVDLDVGFITIAMCEVVRGVRRRKLE